MEIHDLTSRFDEISLEDGIPFEYSETHHPYNKGEITYSCQLKN